MAYDIKKDKNPFAINILKLQRYNFDFFSTEEVVLFEYLIVKAQAFGYKEFYHSTQTISSETGIKRRKLLSILNRFQDLGFLEIEIKGFPKIKYFFVNLLKIQDLIPQIYQFVHSYQLDVQTYKLYVQMYQPYVQTYQQKNTNKNIKKETKEETIVVDTDIASFSTTINDFLFDLKKELKLNDKQIEYKMSELQPVYDNYEKDDILTFLRSFFLKKNSSNISLFLKQDPLNGRKNVWIEQEISDEKEAAKKVAESLQEVYNQRRVMASKEKGAKRGYSKTSLAINNAIISKVMHALKVRGENAINNAFIAYADAIIKNEIQPQKILPYFFTINAGEFSVLDAYLDRFNVAYSYQK